MPLFIRVYLILLFSYFGSLQLTAEQAAPKSLIPSSAWVDKTFTTYPYNPHVSQEVWDTLTPLFLPYDHPIRADLDKLFHKKRAIKNLKSLEAAHFKDIKPQQWTRIVVARHPQFPGYFFKFYLDNQRYHLQKPEHYFWTLRINGAEVIREFIETNNLQNLFKVPKKWIYPLPAEPSPPGDLVRKNFILVEEDMDIYNEKENNNKWGSEAITKDKLLVFCYMVSTLGLKDCAKPKNAPFSKDGRIAFVDTQTFYNWPISYHKLTPFLSPEMQLYWTELTDK